MGPGAGKEAKLGVFWVEIPDLRGEVRDQDLLETPRCSHQAEGAGVRAPCSEGWPLSLSDAAALERSRCLLGLGLPRAGMASPTVTLARSVFTRVCSSPKSPSDSSQAKVTLGSQDGNGCGSRGKGPLEEVTTRTLDRAARTAATANSCVAFTVLQDCPKNATH